MSLIANRYQILDTLADGEWSQVFLVEDTKLGVKRVVKMIHEEFSEHSELRRRLHNEARTMAQLRHPNVLRVYDVAEEGGRFYLVTEYHPAGSLGDRLERSGALPVDEAVAIMLEVLDALTTVHALGVIHRDLKPANILISAEGRAVVADFGIATSVDAELRSTGIGGLLGTFAYMAPEQRLRSSEVAPVADVYGAAATLFEMVTGNSPMDLFAATDDSPRLSGLPPKLASAIFKATRYKVGERTSTPAAFAEHLREAQAELVHIQVDDSEELLPDDMLRWYRRSMIEYRDRLRAALELLPRDFDAATREIRAVAHRLHGSGASFGFPELSGAAAEAHVATSGTVSDATHALIRALTEALGEGPEISSTIAALIADPMLAVTIAEALRRAGHQVLLGSDADALEAMEASQRVDLVVCELVDRDDPLLDWLARRAEVPGAIRVPSVVICADYGVENKALAYGAERFLGLPIDVGTLAATVESVLARPAREQRTHGGTGILDHISFLHAVLEARSAGQGGCVALVLASRGEDTQGVSVTPETIKRLQTHLEGLPDPEVILGRWSRAALGVLLPGRSLDEAVEELEDALKGAGGDGEGGAAKLTGGLAQLGADSIGRAMRLAEDQAERSRSCRPGRLLVAQDAVTLVQRVLLVDDDEMIGALVSSVLSGEGLEVHQRMDARELVHHALRFEPSLMILDVEMPGVDGYKALQQVRANKRLRDLPILMLTARTAENDVVLSLEMGADDYLSKPLRAAELRARVRRLLRSSSH